MDLSRGMKVNEFADLTISEFVSEYNEEKPNIVWSGRKHLETHEYINEPLDQVKPHSCFKSSDEGPSLLFFCVDLNQSWTVGNLVLSSFIPRVLRTCQISIGSRLRALGCEQSQSFWHHGVMFMVCWRHPVFIGLFGWTERISWLLILSGCSSGYLITIGWTKLFIEV